MICAKGSNADNRFKIGIKKTQPAALKCKIALATPLTSIFLHRLFGSGAMSPSFLLCSTYHLYIVF